MVIGWGGVGVRDWRAGSRKKVNQQVSFPHVLDLTPYVSPPPPPAAKPSKKPRRPAADPAAGGAGGDSYMFDLQAVVLHSGPR